MTTIQTQVYYMLQFLIDRPGDAWMVVVWAVAGLLLVPAIESWRRAYQGLAPVREVLASIPADPANPSAPPIRVDHTDLGWSFFWRLLPFYGVAVWIAYQGAFGSDPTIEKVVPLGWASVGLVGYLTFVGGKKAILGR